MNRSKLFLIVTLTGILWSCSGNSEEQTESAESANGTENLTSNFLLDINSLNDEQIKKPIQEFKKVAEKQAIKTMSLDQNNIEEVLETAKKFEHTVIVVGVHTIVRVKNLEDCNQSGSWGACMPIAEGFIKKGSLIFKEDYMNNIIGIPDNQERTVYFFN